MGFHAPSMESCSSGEEVLVKARKPYTITKQRERWTEEEHNRFLNALRLYGRAWQRIEEHIGTKTAIQIRSHAQKFFSKIEKEALAKGISPGQTLDIDIPPPRPKRKPSNPYPRKTGANISSSIKEGKHDQTLTASHSSCPNEEALDLEKGPDETLARTETQENAARSHGNGACAEVLALFSDAPPPSVSAQACPGNPLVFKEFVPMPQEGKKGKTAMNKLGSATAKENREYTSDGNVNICRIEGLHIDSQVRAASLEGLDKLRQTEKVERSSADLENVPTCQEHVSKHPFEEVKGEGEQVAHSDPKNAPAANQQSAQTSTNTLRHPSISAASEHYADSPFSFIHQLPSFPPFCLPHGQDAYRSLCNSSSTFSNLIVSALMQNPAAHAAATLAASFWHPHCSDKSKNPIMETLNGMIPGHMNPHPSMAAIAASTVAAATAWWAMHGLLPLCSPPFPPSFPFVSAATTTSPIMSTKQDVEESKERRDSSPQIQPQQDKHMLNSVSPEQVMLRRSASKSSPSSDTDESRGLERLNETTLKLSSVNEPASTPEVTFYNEKNIVRSRKGKEDHSHDTSEHCSSEAACTMQENPKGKVELEESPVSHDSVVENGFGRYRSSVNCVNESRKEVSEEGRLAFQALFSREELPQSFSPRSAVDGAAQDSNERGAPTLSVDLNFNAHACTTEPNHVSAPDDVNLRNNDQLDKFVSTCEIGNLKPRARRMGFKPYKRCSTEANAGRVNSDEEKGSKRLHMEGKASNL